MAPNFRFKVKEFKFILKMTDISKENGKEIEYLIIGRRRHNRFSSRCIVTRNDGEVLDLTD